MVESYVVCRGLSRRFVVVCRRSRIVDLSNLLISHDVYHPVALAQPLRSSHGGAKEGGTIQTPTDRHTGALTL
jgi:hypothetical protein